MENLDNDTHTGSDKTVGPFAFQTQSKFPIHAKPNTGASAAFQEHLAKRRLDSSANVAHTDNAVGGNASAMASQPENGIVCSENKGGSAPRRDASYFKNLNDFNLAMAASSSAASEKQNETKTPSHNNGGSAIATATTGVLGADFAFIKTSRNYTMPPVAVVTETTEGASNSDAPTQTATDAGAPHSTQASTAPPPAGSAAAAHTILVNPRQKGNPVLKYIRNVPWQFDEAIAPDFLIGKRNCALFLSLRYHNLHPDYIHARLRELGQGYTLRVMLVVIDVKDPDAALQELSRIAVFKSWTLLIASNEREAGRYLETYKIYENKPPDMLQGIKPQDYLSQLRACLTTVKSVNKTDTVTLLSTFGSLRDIMRARKDDLRLCPGFGDQKAERLHTVLHTPFKKSARKPTSYHLQRSKDIGSASTGT